MVFGMASDCPLTFSDRKDIPVWCWMFSSLPESFYNTTTSNVIYVLLYYYCSIGYFMYLRILKQDVALFIVTPVSK